MPEHLDQSNFSIVKIVEKKPDAPSKESAPVEEAVEEKPKAKKSK